jgi:clorobiocin biosynthesis protein CloN7
MIFAPLVPLLVDDYTVVTFDPRGIGRNTLTSVPQQVAVSTQADDVYRLLQAVSDEPVAVFASSGGAVTALELAARQPERVGTLVVHEPPLVELLPDRAELPVAMDALAGRCAADGPERAMREFLRISGQAGRLDDYTVPARLLPAVDFFLRYMISAIVRYRPEPAALPELAIGVGTGAGQLAHRGATALGELLGIPTTAFPGEHVGFATHAQPAAGVLRELLGKR